MRFRAFVVVFVALSLVATYLTLTRFRRSPKAGAQTASSASRASNAVISPPVSKTSVEERMLSTSTTAVPQARGGEPAVKKVGEPDFPHGRIAAFIPTTDWKDVGDATAAAAFETFLWAGKEGDVDRLASLVTFLGAKDFDAFFKELPEETRRKYGTPEAVAALMLVNDGMTRERLRTLVVGKQDGDVAIVTADFEIENSQKQGRVFWIARTPAGFRIVVSAQEVGEFVAGKPSRPPYRPRK